MSTSDGIERINSSTPIDEGFTGINIYEITRSLVENHVNDTLAFYRADKRFRVTERFAEDDGHKIIDIANNLSGDPEDPYWEGTQIIEYDNEGKITYVSGRSNNYYSDKGDHIVMGTSLTAHGNAQNHDIDCVITIDKETGQGKASLRELTRINGSTDLLGEYILKYRKGVPGFELDHIKLERYLQLSTDDMRKFISGRFIPLDDVIAMAVDPWRNSGSWVDWRQKKRISEIDEDPAFIPLGWYSDGHAGGYVSGFNHDQDRIYGYAHPLKHDPDGWLVFVRLSKPDARGGYYSEEAQHQGRALIMRVDRTSIEVRDIEEVPTILAYVSIDGKTHSISIPMKIGRYNELTEENNRSATNFFTAEDGIAYPFVYLTSKMIMDAIEHGHYFTNMLNAALELLYGETFTE